MHLCYLWQSFTAFHNCRAVLYSQLFALSSILWSYCYYRRRLRSYLPALCSKLTALFCSCCLMWHFSVYICVKLNTFTLIQYYASCLETHFIDSHCSTCLSLYFQSEVCDIICTVQQYTCLHSLFIVCIWFHYHGKVIMWVVLICICYNSLSFLTVDTVMVDRNVQIQIKW